MTDLLQQRSEQEQAIFQLRAEAGIATVRAWLYREQARLNKQWPDLFGDPLMVAQGEARGIRRLLSVIDDGPRQPKEA